MPEDPDDVTISYTVKELLSDMQKSQTQGFARVEKGLEAKADKADIKRVEERLDRHETRLGSVEARQSVDEAKAQGADRVKSSNQDRMARMWAGIAAVAALALAVITILLH